MFAVDTHLLQTVDVTTPLHAVICAGACGLHHNKMVAGSKLQFLFFIITKTSTFMSLGVFSQSKDMNLDMTELKLC